MSPGFGHEHVKSHIGRVLETYMDHLRVTYTCVGSWLIKQRETKAGVEPDECYLFGREWVNDRPTKPDLAIEVVWTSGGLNKLEIYRRLGVREVWFWIDGAIGVHELTVNGYEARARSVFLPGVDLTVIAEVLQIECTSDALAEMRARLARLNG